MHILWINQAAAFLGGCERYVFDTSALLHKQGIRSTLLYGVDGWTDPAYTSGFDGGAFPAVDIPRQVAEIAPDVIYIHRLPTPDSLSQLKRCNLPKVRFYHDHKLFCPREHKYTLRGRKTCTRTVGAACWGCGVVNRVPRGNGESRGFRLTIPTTLHREQQENIATFDAFAVGSHYMADHLAAHGFPRERTHVQPLYTFPPQAEEESEATHRNPRLLLFAGTLTTGKGVDTLLDALVRLKSGGRLLILGSGHFEPEYRAQADRLGIAELITWGGRCSAEELARAYRNCAAVVFPSRSPETFGLIGPEAMSHGTPVIATAVGGTREWLEDGVTGLATPPNDPIALASAIDTLLTNSKLRQRLGVAARQRYLANFTPERHIGALVQMFCELTGARARESRPALMPLSGGKALVAK